MSDATRSSTFTPATTCLRSPERGRSIRLIRPSSSSPVRGVHARARPLHVLLRHSRDRSARFEATQIDVDIDASSVDTAMPARRRPSAERGLLRRRTPPDHLLPLPGRDTAGSRSLHGARPADRPRHHPTGSACRRCVRTSARRARQRPNRLESDGEGARAVWGITWNAPVRGGGVSLADEVDLELDVSMGPGHGRSRSHGVGVSVRGAGSIW